MSKRALTLLVVVALAAGLGLWASQRHFGGVRPAAAPAVASFTLLPTPRALPAFSLQQSDGTPLTGDELKGHWTVVFLGFTHCPDICPTTLAQLAGAQKQWASLPEASRPRVLFVSADPDRDSPTLTGEYAHAFHPDTLAATADVPTLENFAKSLGFVFMKVPGQGYEQNPNDYSMDHSSAIAVLDPQGQLAGLIRPPFQPKAIAADMRALTGASSK